MRIVGRLEDAFRQLEIALGELILFVLHKLLKFDLVLIDGLGLGRVVDGNKIGVRQPHDRGAAGLRKRAPVGEVFVDKLGVPVEVVVD